MYTLNRRMLDTGSRQTFFHLVAFSKMTNGPAQVPNRTLWGWELGFENPVHKPV